MSDPIICVIPCCKRKNASGDMANPFTNTSKLTLPKTWALLSKGRSGMRRLADDDTSIYLNSDSNMTSALYLYDGSFYNQLERPLLMSNIRSNRLKLYILSAWYGIVDATEPLHNYEAKMTGKTARNWRENGLVHVIADALLTAKPSNVYGFFAGNSTWSGSNAKYRYFFTAGLDEALQNGLDTGVSGCFYRASGRGTTAILGGLGKVCNELVRRDFDENYVLHVAKNGEQINHVMVKFDDASQ